MKSLTAATHDEEHAVLSEINALADHIRALRGDTVANSVQIKTLTGVLQAKWIEVRVLRAPPAGETLGLPGPGTRRARMPQST